LISTSFDQRRKDLFKKKIPTPKGHSLVVLRLDRFSKHSVDMGIELQ